VTTHANTGEIAAKSLLLIVFLAAVSVALSLTPIVLEINGENVIYAEEFLKIGADFIFAIICVD